MKILMTTDNIGGIWTFSLEMARGLNRAGAEVILAVIGDPLTFRQKKEMSGIAYRYFSAKQEWMENSLENVYATGQWLLWLKELEKPDIVHLHIYALGCLDWNVPVIITLHSCVTTWWQSVKNEKAPESWNTYRNHVKAGIQSADYVVAPSKYMLDAAEKEYGPIRNKKVIYNGRNKNLFKRGRKEKIVFGMGRLWDEGKNLSLLLEAAGQMNYPVCIAGNYQHEDNKPVTPNVHFLGQLSRQQVSEWLSRSWIFVLPVKYEPFGYSFLEAAFSGCAMVGGDIPSLREIWGDSMIFVDPGKPTLLAQKLNELMANDWHLNHLSNLAYNRACEKYTENVMLADYHMLYTKMLNFNRKLLHH